jgi:hypothetical protein
VASTAIAALIASVSAHSVRDALDDFTVFSSCVN